MYADALVFIVFFLSLSWKKETRGRAVVGDPLAFLTVVMKNYYETIILVETQNLASEVVGS